MRSANMFNTITMLMLLLLFSAGCTCASSDSTYTRARHAMVERQIEARGIKDERILEAMRRVERHRFVPMPYTPNAYTDGPLPIGEKQTISQPYIVAIMTGLLELNEDDKVLEIGTGSGYQAAILGELAAEVYTIEIVEALGRRSSALLDSLGYENVTVRIGDGYVGWPTEAPFDAIILTAAPPKIPEPLLAQLAEGGRLVAPVGESSQTLQLVEKHEGRLEYRDVIQVRFVPMTGQAQKQD